jgi:hypothetical protein
VSLFFNPEPSVMLKIKRHYQKLPTCKFCSLNLSITDANQFTVISYGTLKIQITQLHTCNRGWSLNCQHISHSAFKNNVVSNFNHSFIKTLQEALVQQSKFECNSSR